MFSLKSFKGRLNKNYTNSSRSSYFPDYDFVDTSAATVHKSLLLDGCCLLRNAISPERVGALFDRIDGISKEKEDQVRVGGIVDVFQRFHITTEEYSAQFPGDSLFDILEADKWKAILQTVFGEGEFNEHPHSYTRGIDGRPEVKRNLTSFRPLGFHLDCLYHDPREKFAINFWIPFHPCGYDRPGLQVVPISHVDVRSIIGYTTTEGFAEDNKQEESRWSEERVWGMIKAAKPDALVWQPQMNLGDVLVMTSWVPHASYLPKKASHARRSVELRYVGTGSDPKPIEMSSLKDIGMNFSSRADCLYLTNFFKKQSRISDLPA